MVDDRPHVLHVIDTLDIGGAQRHLISLTGSLQRRGYRCTIATSGEPGVPASEGVEVLTLTRKSIAHSLPLHFTASLIRLLAGRRIDIIHAHLHASSLAAAAASALSGRPLVVTHHSDRSWQPRLHRLLGRRASLQAQQVIAVAHSLAADLAPDGIPALTIPNAVPIPPLETGQGTVARARLGIPPSAYVVGFTGRFTGDKDPLLFVAMAARVAADHPGAHFLMVGDGPLRRDVERHIAAAGLAGRVTLAGFRSDACDLYCATDVVVLCSGREACPLVSLEAMAAARPVVATEVGDLPLQIEHGRTGYIVPRGDPSALAGSVMALSDPRLRSLFGTAGRARVTEQYSLDSMVARTLGVYATLLPLKWAGRVPTAAS